MNILIVGNSDPKQTRGPICFTKKHIKQIREVLPNAKIRVTPNAEKHARELRLADIIIKTFGYPVDFKKADNLMWVHSGSAGVSDLIAELAGKDVPLTNSSGVAPVPISEWVAGVMLMFAKRLYLTTRNQIEKKKWIRNYQELGGFELNGSTCGIIGLGRIGSQIASICHAIGMKVVVLEHNKKVKSKIIDRSYKNVEDLLKVSDFVVNALPLTDETKNYYDMKLFKLMKAGSYFINIGRGGSVVEKDLIAALKNGTIAGAALDVFATEPLPDTSPLWNLSNVILTPHTSSWTPKYTDRVINIFCENLKAYLAKKKMPTVVDKIRGY